MLHINPISIVNWKSNGMCKGCELLLKWDMPERIPEPMNKMSSFDHVVLLISIQIAEYGFALRGFLWGPQVE